MEVKACLVRLETSPVGCFYLSCWLAANATWRKRIVYGALRLPTANSWDLPLISLHNIIPISFFTPSQPASSLVLFIPRVTYNPSTPVFHRTTDSRIGYCPSLSNFFEFDCTDVIRNLNIPYKCSRVFLFILSKYQTRLVNTVVNTPLVWTEEPLFVVSNFGFCKVSKEIYFVLVKGIFIL